MPELLFQPIGGYALVTPVALALLALLSVGMFLTRASWPRRATLTALRGGAIAVLLFAMLRPTLIYTDVKKNTATLVLLVDKSRSMQVADAVGGKTRWDALTDALSRSVPAIDELGKDLEIKLYTFDAEVQALERKTGELNLPAKPDGEESAIGAALEEILRLEAGKRLVGVVLMSDGAQRTLLPERDQPPQAAAGRMAVDGVPLYAVALGESRGLGQTRDLALTELTVSPTVFVKNELPANAMVRIDGFVNKPVNVELLWEKGGKMEVVETQQLSAAQDGTQMKVELSHVPEVAGEYKLTIRAVPQPGELITTNNELSTFVTVLKGGVSALYLEGRPRTEQKYLRWSLGASRNINVDYFEIDARAEKPLPSESADWFDPGKYDVFIIGDLDSRAFQPEQLKALRERVHDGAGLIMLGGFNSFGPGRYQHTWLYLDLTNAQRPRVSSVLPITIDRTEQQGFGEKVVDDLHLSGEKKMLPTALGERHFLMLLGDRSNNAKLWAALPPLEGGNRFRDVTPLAQVLAATVEGEPLLVTQDFGGGRVIAFAGDSTWRWWMRGFQKEHRRFWRQVVLYLAHKDETDDSGVWVKLARRRLTPSQRVDLTAGAHTVEGDPITDATFKAEVIAPDGKRHSLALHKQTIDFAGSFFDTNLPGDYTVVVTATRGSETLGTARSRFLVQPQDLELDNPASDPGLLASLATLTGGRSLAPEQLKGALEDLHQQPLDLDVKIQNKVDLWDNWPVLLLFVSLLGGEWFCRKRWGLV